MKRQQENFACLLLAAGMSRRMQRDKLSLDWNGVSLLEHSLRRLSPIPFREKILVHKPGDDFAQSLAFTHGFIPVENRFFERGLHSSIRTGLLACRPRIYPYLVALADQPYLETSHYQDLLDAYKQGEQGLLAPVYAGQRGNPAILAPEFREEILLESDKDRGCAYLFERYPERAALLDFGDEAYVRDLDYPEDLKHE